MTTYRATRNEPRVGVGNWTGDFRRGQTYEGCEPIGFDDDGRALYPRGDNQVPEHICVYLASHGILVDARVSEQPAESPVPPSSPTPPQVIALSKDKNDEG